MNDVVTKTEDPSRLAQMFKILSEFEGVDEKKEKGVLDAINEAVKPRTPAKKEKTLKDRMLDKARERQAPAEEPKDGPDLNFTE
jgi:hypothetical protein